MKLLKYGLFALLVLSHYALVLIPVESAYATCIHRPTGMECTAGPSTKCWHTPRGMECVSGR